MSVHVGMVFGDRIVLREHSRERLKIRWVVRCKCGEHHTLLSAYILSGQANRCHKCAQKRRWMKSYAAGETLKKHRVEAWFRNEGLYSGGEIDALCEETLAGLVATFGDTLPPPPASLSVEPAYWFGGVE